MCKTLGSILRTAKEKKKIMKEERREMESGIIVRDLGQQLSMKKFISLLILGSLSAQWFESNQSII